MMCKNDMVYISQVKQHKLKRWYYVLQCFAAVGSRMFHMPSLQKVLPHAHVHSQKFSLGDWPNLG